MREENYQGALVVENRLPGKRYVFLNLQVCYVYTFRL